MLLRVAALCPYRVSISVDSAVVKLLRYWLPEPESSGSTVFAKLITVPFFDVQLSVGAFKPFEKSINWKLKLSQSILACAEDEADAVSMLPATANIPMAVRICFFMQLPYKSLELVSDMYPHIMDVESNKKANIKNTI